jgi:hypothetical protein
MEFADDGVEASDEPAMATETESSEGETEDFDSDIPVDGFDGAAAAEAGAAGGGSGAAVTTAAAAAAVTAAAAVASSGGQHAAAAAAAAVADRELNDALLKGELSTQAALLQLEVRTDEPTSSQLQQLL